MTWIFDPAGAYLLKLRLSQVKVYLTSEEIFVYNFRFQMLRKMSFLQLPKKDAIIAKVLFFLIGKPINIYGSLKEGKKERWGELRNNYSHFCSKMYSHILWGHFFPLRIHKQLKVLFIISTFDSFKKENIFSRQTTQHQSGSFEFPKMTSTRTHAPVKEQTNSACLSVCQCGIINPTSIPADKIRFLHFSKLNSNKI